MQLAAATAAKGTKRPMSGETCCRKDNSKSKILFFSTVLNANTYFFSKSITNAESYLYRNAGLKYAQNLFPRGYFSVASLGIPGPGGHPCYFGGCMWLRG